MKENELQPNRQVKRVPNEGVFMSVSKKAEKLTTALYMLTDFIREDDPMRRRIRETAIGVLSDSRGLSHAMTGDLYFHLARVLAKSWELVSLIEVCVVVGFISDMNHSILKNALIEFIGDLRNRQRVEGFTHIQDLKIGFGEANNFKLKSEFFKLDEEDLLAEKDSFVAPVAQPKGVMSKGHLSRTLSDRKMSFIKNNSEIKTRKTEIGVGSKASEREAKILKLIEEKKDISINDIVSYFGDYTPKTIQRDLISLIQAGKIKKTGERRWSRYSI